MIEYNKRDIISYNELHQVLMMFPIEGCPGKMLEHDIAKGCGEKNDDPLTSVSHISKSMSGRLVKGVKFGLPSIMNMRPSEW